MLSVIIPSHKCPLLQKTIDSLLENSRGSLEVIVILDGYYPDTPIRNDPRVKVLYSDKNPGMRGSINLGLANASGKFVMKTDDHCLFGEGYDKILIESIQDNWLVVPRRYALDMEKWERSIGRPVKDYHYLSYPQKHARYGYCMFPQEWRQMTYERINDPKYDIDDTMTFQGSCWLADKKYFMEHVGFLDDRDETYSSFSGEALEIGLKYWLGGGQVKVNKNVWYAHLFKNSNYYIGRKVERDFKNGLKAKAGYNWAGKHWVNNEEPNMIYPFSWLVEKFWSVPGWPEDRSLWKI